MNTPRPGASKSVACCAILLLGLTTAPGRAGEGRLALVIGDGWACVRETRIISLKQGDQTVVLDGIPPEADLTSLTVHSPRLPLELVSWERLGASGGGSSSNDVQGASLSIRKGRVIWSRTTPDDGARRTPSSPPTDRVQCVIRSPSPWDDLDVDVIYLVAGLKWSARYQVSVRGEQTEEKEPVSVDVSGLVEIENGCSRAFSNAVIRVVGAQESAASDVRTDPGFLMLDEESALSDLWQERVPGPRPQFSYAISGQVTLESRQSADVRLVNTVRTPANRLYLMKSEDFPLGDTGADFPLRKLIVFRNSRANRMGMPLPPGPAQVFLGSMRSKLLQEAWFAHTPADGEIRIDLGLAEEVRGLRRSTGRTVPVAGAFEESIALILQNASESDVLAEVDEKPPVTLEWEVLSSTLDCTESARRLKFSTDIRAHGDKLIEYRLKVRQPRL